MTGSDLDPATGLTPEELSEVFQSNPRAYMAVRGAVAEKHLDKIMRELVQEGSIENYRCAAGDFDKDFYLQINGIELSLECKNVEVIKITTKAEMVSYIQFVEAQGFVPCGYIENALKEFGLAEVGVDKLSGDNLEKVIAALPQSLRQSGLAQYQFSASKVGNTVPGNISDKLFVEQFNSVPISIDFQRTRNSKENPEARFYKTNEIHLVGACLFSRTLEWKFLFAWASGFDRHKEHKDRYHNKLRLKPGVWVSDIRELLSE
jgi:hypothetical protein